MDIAAVHTVGTKAWVRDDAESWIKAEVVKLAKNELIIRLDNGKEQSGKPEDCPLQNPDSGGGVEVREEVPSEPAVLGPTPSICKFWYHCVAQLAFPCSCHTGHD